MTTKVCTKCGVEKDISEFSKNRWARSGFQYKCKQCSKEYFDNYRKTNIKYDKNRQHNYYTENKTKLHDYILKYNYKITLDKYDTIFKKQHGLCAICGQPETCYDKRTSNLKKLSVDHDHTTGEIRGLLCTRCNAGMGMFKDDPTKLKKAIEYLTKISIPTVTMPNISIWTTEQ